MNAVGAGLVLGFVGFPLILVGLGAARLEVVMSSSKVEILLTPFFLALLFGHAFPSLELEPPASPPQSGR